MNKHSDKKWNNDFCITSMSKRELAKRYAPHLTEHAAVNRLMIWINRNEKLVEALMAVGYRKTLRMLSPAQVALIVEYLGEP